MRYARALPIDQLMPAAGSLGVPVATPLVGDFPERLSGRTLSAARTPGTPSIIMSPDPRPWTQIRLGAGTRDDVSRTTFFSHRRRRQQMT